MNSLAKYKEIIFKLIEKVISNQSGNMEKAAELVLESLAKGNYIYIFGAGHCARSTDMKEYPSSNC